MNMKKTKLGKIMPKLLIALSLLCVLAVTMTSCGGSGIDKNKKITDWGGTVGTTAGSESESGIESETGAETETGAESETGNGSGEETEADTGSETESEKPENTKLKDVVVTTKTGFLDTLLAYIGKFLNLITGIMPAHSYILTLLIFAIIFEILFLPFSIKQQKNSIKQAKLRPKEMAIRKKYAGRNDQATQQKVTQEIQELYQKENFNPLGGCMPLLIQLPIILVLYSVVIDPIKHVMGYSPEFSNFMYAYLNHIGEPVNAANGSVELLSKIVDTPIEKFAEIGNFCSNPGEVMAAIDEIKTLAPNFNIGPVNTGLIPEFTFTSAKAWLLLIPVLTFLAYFFSMKINRKLMAQPTVNEADRQAACSNKMMDYTMPLMSVWMTFMVPGAVGIYWIFKSIIGVGKQAILAKTMPLPVFTEADYKAAEKEMLGKSPKKIQKSENAGKVRSLHHIDDEDYDEKGNYIGQPMPETTDRYDVDETSEKTVEKLPENNMTVGASLKDDSDRGEKKEKKSLFSKKEKKADEEETFEANDAEKNDEE